LQRRCKSLGGQKAKAVCEAAQSFGIFWNSVDLLFGLDLQAMLDAAEKSIRVIKSQNFLAREKMQLTQCSQRLEHTRFLQERMLRSVDELQRLHDEFDFATAADTELVVALDFVRSNYIALDAAIDVGDLLEEIGRRALWINKRLMLPKEFIRQLAAASDASRLD